MSKKIVVKVDMHDGRDKQKAIKAVSALVGVDAISVDMASQNMTVIGMVDPVNVVSKLRKASCSAKIVLVGPAKEPEKKDGDAAKKDGEGKKEGEGEKKESDAAKKDGDEADKVAPPTEEQIIADLMNQYRAYNPYYIYMIPHYYVQSMEENPNSCAIC